MRNATIVLGLIVVLTTLAAGGAQSQTAVASILQTMPATQAAAQPTVTAPPLPYNDVIPANHSPVLGGQATESWTPTYIAQEDFERGFMFWMSPTKTIWVLTKTNQKDTSGVWTVYADTFVDGEAPYDPAIVPPNPLLYQPVRGFGKVWRKQRGVSEALGWGTTPEFELITPISYLTNPSGAPGRYLITTLGVEIIALTEDKAGQPGGHWQLVGEMIPGGKFRSPTDARP